MTPPPDTVDKDAMIAALLARIETLTAANARLVARIAELEAKLDQPPKAPNNSSVPPSKGQKASESSKPKPKSKPHAGSHRALHPHPTRRHPVFACRCQGCGTDVRGVLQSACQTYDRIEIPKIEPDVTQVSLYGGVCPGCAKRFKAEPPEGLEPGSPFGPNLRAFVIYLRSVQNIPLARLSEVLRDLLGLEISEGALVNILRDSCKSFAKQTSLLKIRLLSGTALASDGPAGTGEAAESASARPTGGCGCSTMATPPSLSSTRTAPKPSWRPFWANGGRIIGFRIVSAARRAGRKRTINSASPTSSATCNTPSTTAMRCSDRG